MKGKNGNSESLKIAQQLAGANLQAVTGISPDKISFGDQGLIFETDAAATSSVTQAQTRDTSAESSNASVIEYIEMIRQYDTNEIAADSVYKGKRVRVSGPFAMAEKTSSVEIQYGPVLVWFWHTGYSPHLGCFFDDSQRASVGQLSDRETIVLEGIMLGQISPGRVMMNHCLIKSVAPRKE